MDENGKIKNLLFKGNILRKFHSYPHFLINIYTVLVNLGAL